MLASSRAEMQAGSTGFECIVHPQGDGGKSVGSPGRSRLSRNPLCRESRMIRFTVVYSCAHCAHDRGCHRRPAFPAPSFLKGAKLTHTSGALRRDKCGHVSARMFEI